MVALCTSISNASLKSAGSMRAREAPGRVLSESLLSSACGAWSGAQGKCPVTDGEIDRHVWS